MTYIARAPVIGNYEGTMFAGFILSSQSEPDRKLELDKERNRIWVTPGEELQRKIEDKPYTATENLYACLIGFHDSLGNPVSVAFNGRMSNRIEATMKRMGDSAESSLIKTLSDFPPKENDPYIGAVIAMDNNRPSCYFGVHDRNDKPYFLIQGVEVETNKALYIALTSCRDIKELTLDKVNDNNELAQQLFENILGIPPKYGCGAGVCMIKNNAFDLGVYNKQ